jgi:hypothetical protein
MAPGAPAAFAASDAADLIGGVQSVLVLPPAAPAAGAGEGAAAAAPAPSGRAGQLLDGFPVDLELYSYDDRLQIMGAPQA